ncbi:hypothetical protein SATRM34S_06191 [Streptomyces atroolivaceus]
MPVRNPRRDGDFAELEPSPGVRAFICISYAGAPSYAEALRLTPCTLIHIRFLESETR